MKGSYYFEIANKHLVFRFKIKRNITVLTGNSGTGKTTLLEILSTYILNGKGSGFHINTNANFEVFMSNDRRDWKSLFENLNNYIIFLEENNTFIYSKDFVNLLINSSNYFVFITRDYLKTFPYSYQEIYSLECDNSKKFDQRAVYTFKELYSNFPKLPKILDTIITEDSKSGFIFFNKLFNKIEVISAKGNSSIRTFIEFTNRNSILVIADGAAFGPYIDECIKCINESLDKRILLYLPESFEWLLLKAKVIDFPSLDQILENPSDYIESSIYVSWERFFTDLAIKYSDEKYKYSKHNLNDFYLQSVNLDKVKSILPKELQKIIDNQDGQDGQESQNSNDNQQSDNAVNTMNLF